jgi:NAD(P)H-dependent FMN reductase
MHFTIIAGTNRAHSRTIKLSEFLQKELASLISREDQVQILDLKNLPTEIFSPEAYEKKPAALQDFQNCILETNGILSILPEYNGSAPGVFKYFIDMLSFPESLAKKPSAFVGLSAGQFGAVRSVEQMQQVFMYRKAILYPESLFIRHVEQNLYPDGSIKDASLLGMCRQMLTGFVDFAKKLKEV